MGGEGGGGGGLSSSDLKACPQFVYWVLYKELEKIIRENVSEQEKKKPRLKFGPGIIKHLSDFKQMFQLDCVVNSGLCSWGTGKS